MNNKVIIIGAGENGHVVANTIKQSFHFAGFLDDHKKGDEIIGTVGDYAKYLKQYSFFVSIGKNEDKKNKYLELKAAKANFINAIHNTAIIEKNVKLGENIFVGAGSYINVNSVINDNIFINNGCIVEHDNAIGSHCHLAPGVITGGGVTIGESTFIGLGAIINDHLQIGERVTIGSGSVVIDSISPGATAVGIPAKIIKKS